MLIGLGIGMSFVPMTLSATTGTPPHEAGLASSLINTTRQVGGALGLATVATNHLAGSHDVAAALSTGYRAAFAIAGGGLVVGVLLALALPKLPVATTSAPVTALQEVLEENRTQPRAPGQCHRPGLESWWWM